MLLLKIISHLLDYPTQPLFDAADELITSVKHDSLLTPKQRSLLIGFIQQLTTSNLYDAQERYDLLFDRGRALSLLLFEHVHGESRDRGQAMVNLINVYKSKGFEVSSEQLPDYLPLYLEFLSYQEPTYVREWLGDISHLMVMLSERLKERDCHYSVLFDVLIELSGLAVDRESIASSVRQEKRDDTIEAIDKEWEDREVRFDDPAMGKCPTSARQNSNQSLDPTGIQQVPIKWHGTDATEVSGL